MYLINVETVHYIPRISKWLSNSWLSFKLIFSKDIKPCSFNSFKCSNCSSSWTRLWFAFYYTHRIFYVWISEPRVEEKKIYFEGIEKPLINLAFFACHPCQGCECGFWIAPGYRNIFWGFSLASISGQVITWAPAGRLLP